MTWRPRIRTILLLVNVLVLLLPLWGISVLGLYEDELIHQSEAELIAQGAFVGAAYREALLGQLKGLEVSPEATTTDLEQRIGTYGNPVAPRWRGPQAGGEPLNPVFARLKLASETIRARAPEGIEPSAPSDLYAVAAGERIQPLLRIARNVTLAGIRVVDHQGRVVATTGNEYGLSLMVREEVRRALAGEHVSLLRERRSDDPPPPLASISRQSPYRVFVAMPVVESGRVLGAVILSRSPVSVFKALYQIRFPLLAAGMVLLIVALVIALLTSLTIGRPIAALIRQTDRVSKGEKGAAVALAHPVTHEVGLLSESFARMARTLEERAEYIRAFAANVSHEFKTPLTSIRGSVELLRDHLEVMTPEERDRFLSNLEKDALRLDRLVRRLLELARADVLEPPEAHVVVREVLDRLAERFRAGGMHLEVSYGDGTGTACVVEETLESILSNLLDNARQHGGPRVTARVETRAVRDEQGAWVEIDVADDGPGISTANAARVFDAFFTTARDKGGTGLGLSIVRSLLSAHGGSIALVPAEKGTFFRLRVPA